MSYDPAYQRGYYLARREALCQQQRDLYDRARDTQRKRAWVHQNRQRYQRYQATYYQTHKEIIEMTPDEFRAIRLAKGWTKVALATMMEVTPQAIYQWENGMRKIFPSVAFHVRGIPANPQHKARKEKATPK